jgi:hypothetical protein
LAVDTVRLVVYDGTVAAAIRNALGPAVLMTGLRVTSLPR